MQRLVTHDLYSTFCAHCSVHRQAVVPKLWSMLVVTGGISRCDSISRLCEFISAVFGHLHRAWELSGSGHLAPPLVINALDYRRLEGFLIIQSMPGWNSEYTKSSTTPFHKNPRPWIIQRMNYNSKEIYVTTFYGGKPFFRNYGVVFTVTFLSLIYSLSWQNTNKMALIVSQIPSKEKSYKCFMHTVWNSVFFLEKDNEC